MSKGIKRIASIALPIAGSFFGPVGAAVGGALGGAISGGGLKGIALGALTGYASAGLGSAVMGSAAGTPLVGQVAGKALQGPTMGSGIIGAATGGGMRALSSTATQIAGSVAGSVKGLAQGASGVANAASDGVSKGLLALGNQAMAQGTADDAAKATEQQNAALERSQQGLAPYTKLGADSVAKINQINQDPSGYIQNNQVYKSLANEAQNRLLANQAAKGKVASGGTADALQERLLGIGNGLLQQDLANLNQSAGQGQNAATNVANIQGQQGAVQAAGTVAQSNALSGGYQNQLNTILALQAANGGRTPMYQPTAISL